jgi:hypothetical protein
MKPDPSLSSLITGDNKYYISLLESSSAYYIAKRNARKEWINGNQKGLENARTKFSHFLFQIDYQMQHFLHGECMSMSGLHQ